MHVLGIRRRHHRTESHRKHPHEWRQRQGGERRNTKNKRVAYAFNGIDLVAWYAGKERVWPAPPRRESKPRRWRPDPLGTFGVGVSLRKPEAEAGDSDSSPEAEGEE